MRHQIKIIQSKSHESVKFKVNNISLSIHDDKRYILDDKRYILDDGRYILDELKL